MPLFHRKTEEEKQQEAEQRHRFEEQQADQQASQQALERGSIPLQAQRRLQDLKQQENHLFTSDLTVDEFVLAKEAGFRPLSQVMGSSVYHVGWQATPGQWSAFGRSQELSVISQALNHARVLALGRLSEEARLIGADAVIGVHLDRAFYEWGRDLIEFSAVGTAVRVGNAPPAQSPALTNLSGQDFWKLHRSGYWPLGIVAGSTVYYVVAGWQNQMATSYWLQSYNQELQDFTAGLYAARHAAMRHVNGQAADLGADGIVGMTIEQSEEEREIEIGENQRRTDMIFTFHAIGTAIAQVADAPTTSAIGAVVNLKP
jgi:uncharacterized protein YbjQ (UPF0145 family)